MAQWRQQEAFHWPDFKGKVQREVSGHFKKLGLFGSF